MIRKNKMFSNNNEDNDKKIPKKNDIDNKNKNDR